MSKIDLYIKQDKNILKYIVEIQKFDKMKSIGEIRNAILNITPVLTHDLIYHDGVNLFLRGLEDHEYNLMFFDLVKRLIDMGAETIIKEDGEVINLQQLAKSIQFTKEIADEVREDINREAEDDDEDC